MCLYYKRDYIDIGGNMFEEFESSWKLGEIL